MSCVVRFASAFLVLGCVLSTDVIAQTIFQESQNVNVAASNINIWNGSSTAALTTNQFYGPTWNANASAGQIYNYTFGGGSVCFIFCTSVPSINLGSYGVALSAYSQGAVGLNLSTSLDPGSLSAQMNANLGTSITQVTPGFLSLTSSSQVLSGTGFQTSISAPQASLTASANVSAGLGIQACAVGCASLSVPGSVSVSQNLASVNANNDGLVVVNGSTVGSLNSGSESPIYQNGYLSLAAALPNLNASASASAGGVQHSSVTSPFLTTQINYGALITDLTGFPLAAQGGDNYSACFAGFCGNAGYNYTANLLTAIQTVSANVQQDITLTPVTYAEYQFSKPVEAGFFIGQQFFQSGAPGTTFEVPVGTTLLVRDSDAAKVKITYLLTEQLTNSTGLDLGTSGSLVVLGADGSAYLGLDISLLGFQLCSCNINLSSSLGPLYQTSLGDGSLGYIPLYSDTSDFSLGSIDGGTANVPVPLPAPAGLLALGALGLSVFRRRISRKRK